jgi:enamine deaminase RidA (YjgF/YER057c/UK114 family)
MSTDPQTLALQEQNGFADAVVVGDDVLLSGVITDPKAAADLEAAYAQTFETIGRTLERAGASWDDVIEINSFHTDLNKQLAAYVAAKQRVVRLPHPVWTAVGTTELVGGRGVTETRVRAKRAAASA